MSMANSRRSSWLIITTAIGLSLITAACGSKSSAIPHPMSPTTSVPTTEAPSSGQVIVPNVAGDQMESAISAIQAVGLAPGGIYVDPSGPKTDTVISTTPAAGSQVSPGTKVIFNLGSGN